MHDNECVISKGRLDLDLAELDLQEVAAHLRNHLGNFLLDRVVATTYINRIIADPTLPHAISAVQALAYLCRKYSRMRMFDHKGPEILTRLGAERFALVPPAILRKYTAQSPWPERAEALAGKGQLQPGLDLLREQLRKMPGNVCLADMVVELENAQGLPPSQDMLRFTPPPALKPFWSCRLFQACAAVNDQEGAMRLWEVLDKECLDEITCNLAAEIMLKEGKREEALALYARSLASDPLQSPIKSRMQEISSPTLVDASVLEKRSANIFLYSYNKAALLASTLDHLSRCRLGGAPIKILLNGCTDDSLAVVRSAQGQFPNNPFSVVSLPVNIGAPAARNWLIADPETLRADYAVFLDDDVTPSPDFLVHFLHAASTRPDAGVVGCKTLYPGTPARYQYLFRNVAIAKPGVLRLSLDTPNEQYDNNTYDFVRETENVMGCCHLLSRQALIDVPSFDLRFSPSQMDDIAHDLDLRLKGHRILYWGLTSCVHDQTTGNQKATRTDMARFGNVAGNDVKFYFRFLDRLEALREMRNPEATNSPLEFLN